MLCEMLRHKLTLTHVGDFRDLHLAIFVIVDKGLMDDKKTSATTFFGRIRNGIKKYTGGYYFSALILLSIPAFIIDILTFLPDQILYGVAAILALPCAMIFNRRASPEYKKRLAEHVKMHIKSTEGKKKAYASRWMGLLVLLFGTITMVTAHVVKKAFAIEGTGIFTLAALVTIFAAVIISDVLADRKFKNQNDKGEDQ